MITESPCYMKSAVEGTVKNWPYSFLCFLGISAMKLSVLLYMSLVRYMLILIFERIVLWNSYEVLYINIQTLSYLDECF